MIVPLPILHLEDDPLDTKLVDKLMKADGLAAQIDRVDTLARFREALEHQSYALILADYTVPGTDPMGRAAAWPSSYARRCRSFSFPAR